MLQVIREDAVTTCGLLASRMNYRVGEVDSDYLPANTNTFRSREKHRAPP